MQTEREIRERLFEDLFLSTPDPWNFKTSSYEIGKRKITLETLAGKRFSHAIELGCATGYLTKDLSKICSKVIGIDVSDRALDLARELNHAHNIAYLKHDVSDLNLEHSFDLFILSEILYFLSPKEIKDLAIYLQTIRCSKSTCVLVNWTGNSDLDLKGEAAAEIFIQASDWIHVEHRSEANYVIDRLITEN